jgi:hypothetical protein
MTLHPIPLNFFIYEEIVISFLSGYTVDCGVNYEVTLKPTQLFAHPNISPPPPSSFYQLISLFRGLSVGRMLHWPLTLPPVTRVFSLQMTHQQYFRYLIRREKNSRIKYL